jgi:Flp pilus assembly pilin Flp
MGGMVTSGSAEDDRMRLSHEIGQTMAEYGVTLSVITLAIVGAFAAFSDQIIGAIQRVIALVPA